MRMVAMSWMHCRLENIRCALWSSMDTFKPRLRKAPTSSPLAPEEPPASAGSACIESVDRRSSGFVILRYFAGSSRIDDSARSFGVPQDDNFAQRDGSVVD